ncbi:hypothetical protein OPKNFCMD_5732 [Methylobacterium crusticola]|uniref:Sulfur globule protein n=1 Tax=Methylobacterium crusticola TaxID=1697972 RepID=A0ABQ4R6W6_9HYPH|nr:hypothetical protein [Methylobacterium crusticola]GJD52964.1 hypothetical protein OPKNFCMD_5732 [Methylobacterium crusticola]
MRRTLVLAVTAAGALVVLAAAPADARGSSRRGGVHGTVAHGGERGGHGGPVAARPAYGALRGAGPGGYGYPPAYGYPPGYGYRGHYGTRGAIVGGAFGAGYYRGGAYGPQVGDAPGYAPAGYGDPAGCRRCW